MKNSYKMNSLVSNSHVDNKLDMKIISIINALQDIEGLHIENLLEFNDYLTENNLGVFLLYRQIDFIKKPVFADNLVITTYPYNTTSVRGYRHIFINDDKGDLLVTTNSFGAFVDLESYTPVRIPKEIAKTIKDGEQSDLMEVLPRKINYTSDSELLINEFHVRKSHIDRYNHVNNAYYIEFALDSINEDLDFNRIRAEYNKSYQYGDIVKVYINKQENGNNVIVLKNSIEEINAIIEFSTF